MVLARPNPVRRKIAARPLRRPVHEIHGQCPDAGSVHQETKAFLDPFPIPFTFPPWFFLFWRPGKGTGRRIVNSPPDNRQTSSYNPRLTLRTRPSRLRLLRCSQADSVSRALVRGIFAVLFGRLRGLLLDSAAWQMQELGRIRGGSSCHACLHQTSAQRGPRLS